MLLIKSPSFHADGFSGGFPPCSQKKGRRCRRRRKLVVVISSSTSKLQNQLDQNCSLAEALNWLEQDHIRPDAAYAALLRRCANARALPEGRQVHAHIANCGRERETFVGNTLVDMYGKCGSLQDARKVFDAIHKRNVFSWNIMIAAYAQNGHLQAARFMFDRMTKRDVVSYTTMLAAYAQNGHLQDARFIFDHMPERSVVSWNAMMAAYAQNGHGREALKLFQWMKLEGVKPTKLTFVSILDACGSLGDLEAVKATEAIVGSTEFHSEAGIRTCLVSMYGKCGSVIEARNVFDKMPERDLVTWSAMISASAQNGHEKEAIQLFRNMDLAGVQPDKVTYVSILDACANCAALMEGKLIHGEIVESGLKTDLELETAIVNMYSKCGSLHVARGMFGKMARQDVVSWSAMIAAYAQNGHFGQALEVFRLMNLDGVQPNGITFVGVISACSHAGLFDDGCYYFVCMIGDYGIAPDTDIFQCMIDLLCRAGQLDVAEELISCMPSEPRDIAWRTLLSACKVQNNVKLGAYAARHVSELDPEDSVPYVMISDILRQSEGEQRAADAAAT